MPKSSSGKTATDKRTPLIAASWGFAEASFFFIVPDVLLSWYAIHNRRKALIACAYALAGAMLGGAAVWWWGQHDIAAARRFLQQLPAINAPLVASVHEQLQESGLVSLFVGPIKGIPYKIYAVEAANLGYEFTVFLLVSIPARLMRFIAVAALFAAVGQLMQSAFSLRTVRIAHIGVWLLFYSWYFCVMGRN